jgi:hypothetical protein
MILKKNSGSGGFGSRPEVACFWQITPSVYIFSGGFKSEKCYGFRQKKATARNSGNKKSRP